MNPELSKRIRSAPFPILAETWDRPKPPTQICLHHTASGRGTDGDITGWKNDGQPVSTPLIIDRDGSAIQLYPSMRWAYSLGLMLPLNERRAVEAATLAVEIDSWGWLTERGGKFYTYVGSEVPAAEVCSLNTPFRGQRHFQKYSREQIETVRLLLIEWHERYGIPIKFIPERFFELYNGAIHGTVPGLYSHCSFRSDKTDLFPQPEMIAMLRSL